jgi:hypothetical protein
MDTNLDNGDTNVVCVNELTMYALTLAAEFTRGMTLEMAEAYAPLLNAIQDNDPRWRQPSLYDSDTGPAEPDTPDDTSADPPVEGGPPVPIVAILGADGRDTGMTIIGNTIAIPPGTCACGSETATGDDQKLTCDGCGTVLATADESAG